MLGLLLFVLERNLYMDQDKFIEGMCKEINLTEKDVEYIMSLSLAACNKTTKCMVIMEELAELQQAISKMNRDEKCSVCQLIEEMAENEENAPSF